MSRIYNVTEITKCKKTKKSIGCFAKRFIAKEAFSKALGTGIAKGISFNQIIINNENGKPLIKLVGDTKNGRKKLKKKRYKIILSLTDKTSML